MQALTIFILFLNIIPVQNGGAHYLIITYDDFYNAVKPLAEWKTQKGVKAKIVKISEIGNDSTLIKNYVRIAYNSWPIKPEYLLLVGDKQKIPFPLIIWNSFHSHSDNYYTNITGDFHNEIIPGRLWVSDTLEAKTVVAKILIYEREPLLADSLWFKTGVTVVNEDQDSFPADSVYWSDAHYMDSLMLNAGFTKIDTLAESLGDSSFDVINAINSGCSYILYRGTGLRQWDYPFWDIYPEQMHNGLKLPIVISATCATVEGIGYQWLNAGTPQHPKGTVGFFGTTTALMHAAEFRSALTRGTIENIFCDSLSTLGQAAEAGRLKYYEIFHNTLEYNSWTCLGDPEMTIRTAIPKQIEVIHDTILWTSQQGYSINVHVDYNSMPVSDALVCVMALTDTTIYHFQRTDNEGNVTFIDTFRLPGDTVLFTVTGRNLKTYCDSVGVRFSEGPYVLLKSFFLLDSINGNNNATANPGENIEIPVWLKNWGNETGLNISATIQKDPTDTLFILDDTIKYFGNIPASDSAYTSTDGYNVIIAQNCPDNYEIHLQLIIRDEYDSIWISNFNFMVHAPVILFNDYSFPGNLKYIPAGDTSPMFIELKNIGSSCADSVCGKIWSSDSFLIILDSLSTFTPIEPESTGNNLSDPFIIASVDPSPVNHPANISIEVTSGVYVDTFNFTIYIGQKDYLIWDKDLNHSSGPVIKLLLDSLRYIGDYTTDELPSEYLGLYKSLFVCCGIYPNNYIIKDTSSSAQTIVDYLSALNGKVYMEGGDVWYADPHNNNGYNFSPLFRINPVSNSVGQFPKVLGTDNSFTRTMEFTYSGEHNSIDRINPYGSAVTIFKNDYNSFNCGVCANHKTVGISFELGGLVDSIEPSTRLTLIDSIMNFFEIEPSGITEITRYISENFNLTVVPNPARKSAKLHLQIPEALIPAGLDIYDVSGRKVKSFSPAQIFKRQQIIWDGTDQLGRKLPQGIYFIQVKTRSETITKKMILLH